MLLSYVAIYDLMSVSFFAPMEKAADFRFSDFYTLVANDRAEKQVDPDIVIVPVDGCRRGEIARVITDLDYCSPAAVGLDIVFTRPADPASDELSEALASCANLVMPVEMEETADRGHYIVNHSSWYDSIVMPDGGFGAVNIQGDRESWSTVRDFKGFFLTSESDTIMSLPMALASLLSEEAGQKLIDRRNEDEAISFISREFNIVYPDEIMARQAEIEGKIVLVGKLDDGADIHQTPIDNCTPGLIAQAYIAATILSGDYTRRLTETETTLIAALLCFITAWLNLRLADKPMGSLAVRLIQLVWLYLMIVGGTWVYIRWNVDLNFAYAMLMATLGVAACDIFDGIFAENALADRIAGAYHKIQHIYGTRKKNENRQIAADTDGDNDDDDDGVGHA